MINRRNEILKKIEEKQSQEYIAARESEVWNKGKYKNTSNASLSKIYLTALRKEIQDLYTELENTPE